MRGFPKQSLETAANLHREFAVTVLDDLTVLIGFAILDGDSVAEDYAIQYEYKLAPLILSWQSYVYYQARGYFREEKRKIHSSEEEIPSLQLGFKHRRWRSHYDWP